MIPRELVERILFLLDVKFLLKCRFVNREFNEIIQSSALLQYFLACEAAGVIDNPQSSLSYAERLEALKKREDAWKKIEPIFETTIKVNHQPSSFSIYALTGGAYFLDDRNLKDMHYCQLPSSPQDNPQWIKIPAHLGECWPAVLINFALSEYEHDLMINVISSNIGGQPDVQYSIDLALLKFSTGEYHPLARQPRIHVQSSHSARPSVIPRIVGDTLAFVVHSGGYTFPDTLFIFDWKTGHKRLQHDPTENAYSDLVFVSPELLLVPNLVLSHFEVWHIPPSNPNPNPPIQVLSLKMPAISPDYYLFDVGCCGVPNPFLDSMSYFPRRPFFSSPENSIITVNLDLGTFQETRNQLGLPIWFTNEITVQKLADPDDRAVRFDVQSTLLSMKPHSRSFPRTHGPSTFETFPTSPASHITADSSAISSTTSPASAWDFSQVRWTDWGPPISRLLQVSDTQSQLIGTSAGQRYAFSIPHPRNWGKSMVSVADFNPYNVRRNMERIREGEDEGDNCDHDTEKRKEEEMEQLTHDGVFSEDVYMGLKCVVYHAPDEYDFDILLMDEERLVGLKLDHNDRDESVTVLYIG